MRREDVVRWRGVAARVFKGDIGGAEELTAGELGYNEECFLTFLACPPHCSRLMRRWRARACIQRQDKLSCAGRHGAAELMAEECPNAGRERERLGASFSDWTHTAD